MSTRTIIEINHDHLNPRELAELIDLFNMLGSSNITGMLNKFGKAFNYSPGIRVLGQRHHSETLKLEVS
jgi:hypothetical protein